jgi:hypothetical protein
MKMRTIYDMGMAIGFISIDKLRVRVGKKFSKNMSRENKRQRIDNKRAPL